MTTRGQRLKEARLNARLNKQQLINKFNEQYAPRRIGRSTVYFWEHDKVKEVEAAHLLGIAKILAVSPYWLEFGDETYKSYSWSKL